MHGRAHLKPHEAPGAASRETDVRSALSAMRDRVDSRLGALVAADGAPPVALNRSVRYALLAPGKRVRPLLTMLTAAEFGLDPMAALDAGCAVEMIHTASLVLDDLPCMDNAFTRRGLPATHVNFGEATAVLAAITLLSRAFGVIAEMDSVPSAARADMTAILSWSAGAEGLAAGQERDLNDRSPTDELAKIDDINDQKTGALFTAAVQIGGRLANVDAACMAALATLGREVGLAFQALDDVIDLSRTTTEAGKDTGKDVGKATVATVLGLEPARAEVQRHVTLALGAIAPFSPADGHLRPFIQAMFAHAVTGIDPTIQRP